MTLEEARAARDAALTEIEKRTEAHPVLVDALVKIQSQCAGHADEFSRRVYQIAADALKAAK